LQKTEKPVMKLDYDFVPDGLKKITTGESISGATKKLKPWKKSLSNVRRLQIMQAIYNSVPQKRVWQW
jgi:hypothetical protein